MSWSNITKNSTVFTNIAKNVASWANAAKNILVDFLLKEDGFYLLQETGDKILLEDSSTYSYQTKNTS